MQILSQSPTKRTHLAFQAVKPSIMLLISNPIYICFINFILFISFNQRKTGTEQTEMKKKIKQFLCHIT